MLTKKSTVLLHAVSNSTKDTNGQTNKETNGQTPGIEFGAF